MVGVAGGVVGAVAWRSSAGAVMPALHPRMVPHGRLGLSPSIPAVGGPV